MVINLRLKAIRTARGFTQATMAQALGVPVGTYRNWEQGLHEPDNEKIVEIIRILETTSDYLFGMTDAMQNDEYDKMTRQSLKDDEKILLNLWGDIGDEERVFFRKQLERAAEERRRGNND